LLLTETVCHAADCQIREHFTYCRMFQNACFLKQISNLGHKYRFLSALCIAASCSSVCVLIHVVNVQKPETMSQNMPRIVDKIDPYNMSQKRPRRGSEGSSKFRLKGGSELKALPLLKGKLCSFLSCGFVWCLVIQ